MMTMWRIWLLVISISYQVVKKCEKKSKKKKCYCISKLGRINTDTSDLYL